MLLCQIIVTREFKHYNISKHNLKLRSRIYILRKKEKHAKYLLDVIIAKLIQSYFVILINLLVVYCDGRVLNLQNVCPILMVYIGTVLRHARKMIALPKCQENIYFQYQPSYLLRSWITIQCDKTDYYLYALKQFFGVNLIKERQLHLTPCCLVPHKTVNIAKVDVSILITSVTIINFTTAIPYLYIRMP